MEHARLSIAETFGLRPLTTTLRQAKLVFRGDPQLPKSRFDRTSLDIATPALSVRTWRGKKALDRTVPLLNLFNRTPTPVEDGWSVRFTQVRDFRGGRLTYDSHNGTDFVIPPGTPVVSAAPGRVVSLRREFNRGGLKLAIEHGDGLLTSSNHLGRALVQVGDRVERGQVVALSAYSGVDGLLLFPWLAPHVHYNVSLGGVLVDPFAIEGETSLFRQHNDPRPHQGATSEPFTPTALSRAAVDRLTDALVQAHDRDRFHAIADVTLRGFELLLESVTYPTRFSVPEAGRLLGFDGERRGALDLPFRAEDYDDTAFADDAGLR